MWLYIMGVVNNTWYIISAISECYKSDKQLLSKLKSLKDELLNLKIKHKVINYNNNNNIITMIR